MCGIAGFSGTPDKEKLDAMTRSIIHRGPDDDAGLQSANFSLGMRRLSIIDLNDNIYPVKNEDGTIFCVFNGEIYNYLILKEELKARGHTFVTKSDSEVIVHAYEEWGPDFVKHLRGMFAIAIYDHRTEQMLLVRDRLGIKPLYYTEKDGRLIFASEIKALIAGWDVDRTPNDRVVYRFLLTRIHDDSKDTFFNGIKRLMPGHYMQVEKDGNYRIRKYWEPEVNTNFGPEKKKSDADYSQELHEKFVESMQLHLITDVPLGVGLSGGLDSSGVTTAAAALLQQGTNLHTNNQLLTFSAIHPGETIDEAEYIDEVVAATGAKSIRVVPDVNEFWGEIKQWMFYQEEPTISTAPYAYYTVMREAKKYVKVLLSGQGGDELFAGYIPYFMTYVQTASDANAYLAIMREFFQGYDMYKPFLLQKLKQRFQSGNMLSIGKMVTVQNEELRSEATLTHTHSRNLNERLLYDVTVGSVPNLLRYEDKNSMANSIESRVPFLDHEFVEYALSIPASQKIKNGWNRYVYRNAMAGLIPEKNRLRRNKIGFVNNEWEWMKAKADLIMEIFKSESFRSRPYWNAEEVQKEFLAATNGRRWGDWLMFWRILSVEIWLRWYVDEFIAKKDYYETVKRLQYGAKLEDIRNPKIQTEGLLI